MEIKYTNDNHIISDTSCPNACTINVKSTRIMLVGGAWCEECKHFRRHDKKNKIVECSNDVVIPKLKTFKQLNLRT